MSRAHSRTNNNVMTSFIAAFAGMVVAIPVAVTASVLVVKASFSQDQSQLASAVATLSKQMNYAPITTTSTTTQGSGDVNVAGVNSCAGTANTVSAPAATTGSTWSGYGVTTAWHPAHVANSYNTTVSTTTNNTSTTTYTDSYNTKGSFNSVTASVNVDVHNHTNTINSGNTATGNTTNVGSNNNSGNTNSGNTAVVTGNTLNNNSNNNSGNTTDSNNTSSYNPSVLSGNTTTTTVGSYDGNNNTDHSYDNNNNTNTNDSNNTQNGLINNI